MSSLGSLVSYADDSDDSDSIEDQKPNKLQKTTSLVGGYGDDNDNDDDDEEMDVPIDVDMTDTTEQANEKLRLKLQDFYNKLQEGISINENLKKSHAFKNPSIMQKLVDFCDISQYGTAYTSDIFDPNNLPPEDYFDAIAEETKRLEEERVNKLNKKDMQPKEIKETIVPPQQPKKLLSNEDFQAMFQKELSKSKKKPQLKRKWDKKN